MKVFVNPDSHRLIFLGQILTPDSKQLSQFATLESGKSIHLVKKPDQGDQQLQRPTPYERPRNNQVHKNLTFYDIWAISSTCI